MVVGLAAWFMTALCPAAVSAQHRADVVVAAAASPREHYAAERIREAISLLPGRATGVTIRVGTRGSEVFTKRPALPSWDAGVSEAFRLERRGNEFLVVGSDPSGVLYGALDLVERIEQAGTLPAALSVTDRPRLKMRGTNLMWTKWGKHGYDWPVTPENFPWFFDRSFMLRYLDFLAENRFNTIYFWSGHPFPYFLELPKYPKAQVLSDKELKDNIEHFKWFTAEADRRGIWTIFQFYNIHVSAGFAEAHKSEGIKIENEEATPLLADYTRYCVSEFIRSYPSVGLLVTAGEALRVRKEEWVRDVIVAGIKETGKEPPLIVREWQLDPDRFKEIIVPAYDNLYTMMKHNVEMLVSTVPDPRHVRWRELGRGHLVNVHENSDVKPLRWASPSFIQEMVRNWLQIGVSGTHVYPMVSWHWPESLDSTEPRLLTTDRDWLWLQAFGRYSWDPNRDSRQEREYWVGQLERRFGSREAGEHILDYYESTGPVLPGIQNLLSIFNMNLSPTVIGSGATVNAILNSIRSNNWMRGPAARPLDSRTLRQYSAMFGEIPVELANKPPMSVREYVQTLNTHSHQRDSITPLRLLRVFQAAADNGLKHARAALQSATASREEAARFVQDAETLVEIVKFYDLKTKAAIHKGMYDHDGSWDDLNEMLGFLERSVESYRRLHRKASKSYRQATDIIEKLSWEVMLKRFEQELAFYTEQKRLAEHGAGVLFLGVNGPFEDASNAFHWSMVDAANRAGLTTSTYLIRPALIDKAKLIIVYNLGDPFVTANRARLQSWVNQGGHLLVWDEKARAYPVGGLLEGIDFEDRIETAYLPDGSWRTLHPATGGITPIQFSESNHPLIEGLNASRFDKSVYAVPSNVAFFDERWNLLARAVLPNRGYDGLGQDGHVQDDHVSGPDWVTRIDPELCSLILERSAGSGKVALIQLGRLDSGVNRHRQFSAALSQNIMSWIQQ